jgi:hypothetical protein
MAWAARARLRELLAAGLIDSFGLAFGWTVFNLIAVAQGGLTAAGLYNAAMLIGVVLSAPVTTWLAQRLHGRVLLVGTAAIEAVLRVGTVVGLLAGWPSPLVAAGVVAMNVVAWAGYAGMRAEVAAVDVRPAAMTRYATGVAAIEAAGAGVAGLLPIGPGDTLHDPLLLGAVAVYAASLIPQFLTARRALVPSARQARAEGSSGRHSPYRRALSPTMTEGLPSDARPPSWMPRHRRGWGRRRARSQHRRPELRPGLPATLQATLHAALPGPLGALIAGAVVMLLASGPTKLSVALSAELHGNASVVVAAAAFTAGCLLASVAVDLAPRLRLPNAVTWPLWGVGMLIGWIAAPWHLAGLVLAQFLSGLSLTAFEGAMDARVAQEARPGEVTTALAWSASIRAMGSAVAVRYLPLIVAAPAVGTLSGVAAAFLAVGGAVAWAATGVLRRPGALRSSAAVRPVSG